MTTFTLNNVSQIELTDGTDPGASIYSVGGGVSVNGFVSSAGVSAGNLRLEGNQIIRTGPVNSEITFQGHNLVTNGDIKSGTFTSGSLLITDGSITDSDGLIQFGSTSLEIDAGVSFGAGSDVLTINASNINSVDSSINISGASVVIEENSLVFQDSSNYTTVVSMSSSTTGSNFVFPNGNGTNGYVLSTDGTGVTSWVAQSGGGTDYGASQGITLNGTSFSVNTGAGVEFGADASGTSTLQLNLYESGNLQFYPGTGGVGSTVGLCESILVPTEVIVGGETNERVQVTASSPEGGKITMFNPNGNNDLTINSGGNVVDSNAQIALGDSSTSDNLILYGGTKLSTDVELGPAITFTEPNSGLKGLELSTNGITHDLPEITLFETGTGTSIVKIYGGTSPAQSNGTAGQIELYYGQGNTPSTPTVTLGGTSGRVILNDGTTQHTVTIGLSSTATQSTSFILPGDYPPSTGYFLTSDSNGDLSWESGGGGGGATSINGLNDASTDATSVTLGFEDSSLGTRSVLVGISPGFSSNQTDCVLIGYNPGISGTLDEVIAIGTDVFNNSDFDHSRTVAIGTSVLHSVVGNISNVTAVGHEAGSDVTTGGSNTFIGYQAGNNVTTGSNITCLGSGSTASASNATNEVTLGDGSVDTLRCATQTIASVSDARDKADIEDLQYGLEFLDGIRPVEFTWDRRPLHPGDITNPTNGTRKAGFIAQELLEAMPNGENEILDLVSNSSPERIEAKYASLIPVMVKAIKDLKREVQELRQRIDSM